MLSLALVLSSTLLHSSCPTVVYLKPLVHSASARLLSLYKPLM